MKIVFRRKQNIENIEISHKSGYLVLWKEPRTNMG